MKLLTHNLLMCNKKGCNINNFPLQINSLKQNLISYEYDQEMVARTLKKIDLPALTEAAKSVKIIYIIFNVMIVTIRWEFINLTLKI